jgi:hypothetical protein
MLDARHLATIRAALLFWREEIHWPVLMQPCFENQDEVPLAPHEVDRLRSVLQFANLRYANYQAATDRLTDQRLFSTVEEAHAAAESGSNLAAVILTAD